MPHPSLALEAAPTVTGFAALGLRSELVEATASLGYDEPTPIQREAIPPLLSGQDLLGQAATGTGKTAAFALPALHGLGPDAPTAPSVLVVVPTRELAVQVSEAMAQYGARLGVQVVALYGGQAIGRQLGALRRGVHVVVATPGRACDHIRRGSLELSSIRTVVLDEADEMLDMGFAEDIETILQSTPDERQTVLFSATVPSRIHAIAARYQRDPVRIRIRADHAEARPDRIQQTAYIVPRSHMAAALGRVLDMESPPSTLVFCRTRTEVEELSKILSGRGYRAESLHGGMDQRARDRVMARLRDGRAELLIATDVAARGLDVDTLTHVVNFGVPTAPESYVHRIGRVGRAGRSGTAITLAEPRQRRLLRTIEGLTHQRIAIEKVPSVADLRRKQLAVTAAAVAEQLQGEGIEAFAPLLDELATEHGERAVALAALHLFHDARGAATSEEEIPEVREATRSGARPRREADSSRRPERSRERGKPRGIAPGKCLLYVGVGAEARVGPGDLVGAIAGETGLVGRQIGPIRIGQRYSVVGVPEESADAVIEALSASKIRGRRAKVRRYD